MINYSEFKQSWLEDIVSAKNTVEKGRKFAVKLIEQWLDNSNLIDNGIYYCDGSGDGGIDVAILSPSESEDNAGDTWYLIQSKYGNGFLGADTLLLEGNKIIQTLSGKRKKLNTTTEGVIDKLNEFRHNAGEYDKIVLMFATEDSLNEEEKETLENLRTIGQAQLGSVFDIKSISIQMIYENLQRNSRQVLSVLLNGIFDTNNLEGKELLVGTSSLPELYFFLKEYQKKTGNLDLIYDKNVRRFLGSRGKVNKAMRNTLSNTPEKFGLFNNGITIVTSDFQKSETEGLLISTPHIVNGCQTSRTIWEVLDKKFGSGGRNLSEESRIWRSKAEKGVVVVKIAKVSSDDETLLEEITRFTNSQNAVRDKDFLALENRFQVWKKEMAEMYGIYLEIQRGGSESQKAFQRTNLKTRQFTEFCNASDLLKVYGSAYKKRAGLAFGKNAPFLPGGEVFQSIMSEGEQDGGEFNIVDLYACYLLDMERARHNFGRGATKSSRRQSRYLFLMVIGELLREMMNSAGLIVNNREFSKALVTVMQNKLAKDRLVENALSIVDDYFSDDGDDIILKEAAYKEQNDLNAFLKSERFGLDEEFSSHLFHLIKDYKRTMKKHFRGEQSDQDLIEKVIKPNAAN